MSSLSCPTCLESACFMAYRPRSVVSLLVTIRRRRAYYHLVALPSRAAPWDRALGLSADALTVAAGEAFSLTGLLSSFAEASDLTLPKLAGLRLGELAVERATKTAGRDVGESLARGEVAGPARDLAWRKDILQAAKI